MAQLIVRDLPDEVVQRLKARAAANGRSAEEEHRTLLRQLLLPEGLADHLLAMPHVGDDDDFARRPELPRTTPL